MAGWVLFSLQTILFIPAIALLILVFYVLYLSAKALNIYIRKNS